MKIRITPLREEHLSAVQSFNRLAGEAGTAFGVSEMVQGDGEPRALLSQCQMVAMDGDICVGGYLRVVMPAVLNGERVQTGNVQSPVSAGVFDKKYLILPAMFLQHLTKEYPCSFSVGMGDISNPWPRTLLAMRWSVEPIPFYFRVHRVLRFLRKMAPLRSTLWRRVGARAAAITGGGKLALAVRQFRPEIPGYAIEAVSRLDQAAASVPFLPPGTRFAVARDEEMLSRLYAPEDARLRLYKIKHRCVTAGWAACLLTAKRDSRYFGNLTVGTIMDAACAPEHASAVIQSVDAALACEGADIVLSNQSAPLWKEAFRAQGFLSYASSYHFGASPKLREALSSNPVADGLVHMNRGDSEGRVNL